MDSLQRKGINFDLNTQALKEYYPKGDWHNAYADVTDLSIFRDRDIIRWKQCQKQKPWQLFIRWQKNFHGSIIVWMCVPYQMYRNCLISRMYLPEKRNGWKRKMHDLTNYFQYVIFISSKKGSSWTPWKRWFCNRQPVSRDTRSKWDSKTFIVAEVMIGVFFYYEI